MKLSIITVCYNSDKYIETAINAVLSQSYPNVEYILVDGASTDNTLSLIKRYAEKFPGRINWISEPDKGIYDAMNKGVQMATGDVIGILNSDDLYAHNQVLETVMNAFTNDASLDMVYGNLVYVKQSDTDKQVRKWVSKPYYDRFFEHGHVPPHPTLFLRRHVYEAAGLFNLNYKLAADYEFMLRVFKRFTFRSLYIPEVFVKMRLGGATNKSVKNIKDGNMEIIRSWKQNGFSPPLTLMPRRFAKRIVQFFI
ncbi:putative glycosyltransferase [Lunatimonas lonarensis]|uniref:Putative glycosyltransferase n=1 Tax=Lunatimonas lonarensis TaxID=1232681 RepID=R7ZPD8_9BACT|nr:glycosyltransferase family 2 protein [Lunatimonas lonarensis]EON75889.1 putative glycosyltransferase [Lunatimonas lonarensis]